VVNIVNHWGYFIYLSWMPSYFHQALGLDLRASSFLAFLPWAVRGGGAVRPDSPAAGQLAGAPGAHAAVGAARACDARMPGTAWVGRRRRAVPRCRGGCCLGWVLWSRVASGPPQTAPRRAAAGDGSGQLGGGAAGGRAGPARRAGDGGAQAHPDGRLPGAGGRAARAGQPRHLAARRRCLPHRRARHHLARCAAAGAPHALRPRLYRPAAVGRRDVRSLGVCALCWAACAAGASAVTPHCWSLGALSGVRAPPAAAATPAVRPRVSAQYARALRAGQAGFVANMSDIAPRHAGQMFGLCNTFGSAAGIVGVSAVGYIVQTTGSFDPVFKLTALLYVLGAVVWNLFCVGTQVFE